MRGGGIAAGIALLAGLVGAAPAQAGAWTRGFGEHYVKVGADSYVGLAWVDPETGEPVDARYFGEQISLYGEVGVLPVWPLQVSVQVPLSIGTLDFGHDSFAEAGRGRATTTRLGDLRVAVQTAILRKGFQLGLGAEVKVPMYANDSVGGEFGSWKPAFPLPGDGQVDVTPALVFGGSLPGTPLYAQGSVGYRFRTEAFVGWDTDLEFVDGIPFSASLGLDKGRLVVQVGVDGLKNVQADAVTREWLGVSGTVLVTVWKGLAIEGRFGGEPWAHNAPQGLSFGVGLSWRPPYPGT